MRLRLLRARIVRARHAEELAGTGTGAAAQLGLGGCGPVVARGGLGGFFCSGFLVGAGPLAEAELTLADGDPEAWRIVDGRLYLNYSKRVQRRWEGDIPGNILKGQANWPAVLNQ